MIFLLSDPRHLLQASGPVVGMVWQGKAAVKTGRFMLGTVSAI